MSIDYFALPTRDNDHLEPILEGTKTDLPIDGTAVLAALQKTRRLKGDGGSLKWENDTDYILVHIHPGHVEVTHNAGRSSTQVDVLIDIIDALGQLASTSGTRSRGSGSGTELDELVRCSWRRMRQPLQTSASKLGWLVAVLAGGFGCGGGPEPAAETPVQPASATPMTRPPGDQAAPRSLATRTDGGCRVDAECTAGTNDAKHFGLCEKGRCVSVSKDVVRTWARASIPSTRGLARPARLSEIEWLKGKTKQTLWVDVQTLGSSAEHRCVSIDFSVEEKQLSGLLPEKPGDKASTNGSWIYDLVLGSDVSLLGPGRTTRGPGKEEAHEAIGGLGEVGHSLVDSSDDGLHYTGVRFQVEPVCVGTGRRVQPECTPSECPSVCASFDFTRAITERGVAQALGHSESFSHGPECSPCLEDTLSPLLPRLKLAFTGDEYVEDSKEGPIFFRERSGCIARTAESKARERGLDPLDSRN